MRFGLGVPRRRRTFVSNGSGVSRGGSQLQRSTGSAARVGAGGERDWGIDLADYRLYYREVVRRLSGGRPQLSEAAKSVLEAAMDTFLPSAPLTWMIGLGADAVARELAAADPVAPRS
jgi:hypothetical protein